MYFLCCSMYFCAVLCIVCFVTFSVLFVYTSSELLPPGGYPIAVKYIISYTISAAPLSTVTLGAQCVQTAATYTTCSVRTLRIAKRYNSKRVTLCCASAGPVTSKFTNVQRLHCSPTRSEVNQGFDSLTNLSGVGNCVDTGLTKVA
jgi:hypothetical protein